MSDRPIQVGDLVQVIHSCCGRYLGAIRIVTKLDASDESECPSCKYRTGHFTKAFFSKSDPMPHGAPAHWLKRIPPIGDLEGTSEDARRPTPEEFSRRVDEMQLDMVKLARDLAGIK